jgi:competence protein ComEA
MFKVILGVLFFTIISLVVFVNLDPNITQSIQSSNVDASLATIALAGEVLKPGTYLFNEGDTLGHVLTLAGGVTNNADLEAYNESLPLQRGMGIYIAPMFDPSDVCMTTKFTKVGINTATETELMTLSNIGQSLASSIVSFRQQEGGFLYLEHIMQVSGIGQATFTRIRNYINLT